MRVLFDQGTPVPLRRLLTGHVIRTAAEQQWSMLENGALLRAAEAAGFDVLVTPDKNIRYQQNLTDRRIALVVLSCSQWGPGLRRHAERVLVAVNAAAPGSYTEVEIPNE
jgi:hypothetical protein